MGTQEWEQAWMDGDVMEGQGMVEDVTFHDSHRGVTRVRTWRYNDGDAKASQGKDEDRKPGSQT
jgi:hypothetical protein